MAKIKALWGGRGRSEGRPGYEENCGARVVTGRNVWVK